MSKQLEERIRELESRIEKLHTNRQILLGIIGLLERESKTRIMQFETRNDWLRKKNRHYERAIMRRNIRILELKDQLCEQTGGKER